MKLNEVFTEIRKEDAEVYELDNRVDEWLSLFKDTYNKGPFSFAVSVENSIVIFSKLIKAFDSDIIIHADAQSKVAYWILPDGELMVCSESEHNSMALRWAIQNNIKLVNKMISKNNIEHARFVAMIELGWVEFSVQGTEMNIVTNEWYSGYTGPRAKMTNKQKESLAKILEVNNITDDEQWKYVY